MRRNFRLPALILMLAAAAGVLLARPAKVQAAQTIARYEESRVKAAYLVRFGQFVEWPAETFQKTDGALVIGVINSDAVFEGLQQLAANRAATGRPVTVRALKSGDDAAPIHILFIGAAERARLAQHVAGVAGRPVLVVTETLNAIQQGATINFMVIDQRVRFEIALNTAEQAGLVVSSRLLSVAARVHRGELRQPVMLARTADYSSVIPDSRATFAHFGSSARKNRSKSPALPG
jgi:hypothetical protein